MRILLYAGKGGTGKTTMAAAAGAKSAALGRRTLVVSLDPAHSLSDAFGLNGETAGRDACVKVADNLWLREVSAASVLEVYWREVHTYLRSLFGAAGLDELLAEEVALLPGMDEVAALISVAEALDEGGFEALILDCAPTAESMRVVSLPAALDWYRRRIGPAERSLLKLARPLARRLTDVPLPGEAWFASLARLTERLAGVDGVLTDPRRTSVRLVANAERMVLKETQRAYVAFCLFGLTVDMVLVNRVLPACAGLDPAWLESERRHLEEARSIFAPLPVVEVPRQAPEPLGHEALLALGGLIYDGTDPLAVTQTERSLRFNKRGGRLEVRLRLPAADKNTLSVHASGLELVVQLGAVRRHVGLPRSFAGAEPVRARQSGEWLVVEFKPAGEVDDGEKD